MYWAHLKGDAKWDRGVYFVILPPPHNTRVKKMNLNFLVYVVAYLNN